MQPTQTFSCGRCRRAFVARENLSAGPIKCPQCGHTMTIVPPSGNAPSGREVYNIVSDIGTGVNVRWRDNLFQLATIGVSLFLGILIGVLVVQDRILGAVVGGFLGVLVGLFGSGIFLMIYRFVRHLLGDHK
jgi:hypothetical protein